MTDRPPDHTPPSQRTQVAPATTERPRVPFLLWLVIILGLIAASVSATIGITGANDSRTRDNQASENQVLALCVADRNAKVTRQAALSVLAVADVPRERERALRTSLDDLDVVLARLLAPEEETGQEICAQAIDLKENP